MKYLIRISIPALFVIFITRCNWDDHGFSSGRDAKPDYARLTKMAKQYLISQPDSVLSSTDSTMAILEKTWLLANQYGDTLSRAEAAYDLGCRYLDRDRYILAEKFLNDSRKAYNDLGKLYLKAKAENRLGIVFSAKGNYSSSQQHLLAASQIFERLDSIRDLSSAFLNIGNNYADQGKPQKAREYYNKVLQISSPDDPKRIGAILNTGILYRSDYPDSALIYYREAAVLIEKHGDLQNKVHLEYNTGNIYVVQNKPRMALSRFTEVLKICQQNNILSGVTRAYYGISMAYEKLGNPDSALFFGKKALQSTFTSGETSLTSTLMEEMAGYYKLKGNLPKVVEYYQRARQFKDSINRITSESVNSEMELLETVQRKEMESEQLKINLSLNQARLRNGALILGLLIIFIILLALLLKKSIRLNRERLHAYAVLMDKYIAERANRKMESDGGMNENQSANIKSPHSDPLLDALTNYYTSEKPYLDPKLKLDTVVERLNTNPKALAQALKAFNNSNFNTFTNYFRVEEAKRIMEDSRFHNYKIEAVAREAGFGTRTTFYNTFESLTGIKPSYYRESISKN